MTVLLLKFRKYSIKILTKVLFLFCLFFISSCQKSIDHIVKLDLPRGGDVNITSLTQVIQRIPNDANARNVRGAAFGSIRLYRKALEDFNAAITLNPHFYQAYANRALVHHAIGNPGEAIEDYTQALKINPGYDIAYIGRGNVYRLYGYKTQAFQDYQFAIKLGSRNPRAYHYRGLIYQIHGQHRLAIKDFSKAIFIAESISQNSPEPYNSRGMSYLILGNKNAALKDFNQALNLDRKNAVFWVSQALFYEEIGNKKRAFKSYMQAKVLDPDYEPAILGVERTRM